MAFLQLKDYAITVWPVRRKQRVQQQEQRRHLQQVRRVLQKRQQQEPKRGQEPVLVPEQMLQEVQEVREEWRE